MRTLLEQTEDCFGKSTEARQGEKITEIVRKHTWQGFINQVCRNRKSSWHYAGIIVSSRSCPVNDKGGDHTICIGGSNARTFARDVPVKDRQASLCYRCL